MKGEEGAKWKDGSELHGDTCAQTQLTFNSSRCAFSMCLLVVFVDRTLLPGLSSRWRKKSTVMEGQEVRVMSMPSLILNRMKGCRGTCQYSRDGVACRRDRVSFHWRLVPGRCAWRGRLWFTLGRRRRFRDLRSLWFSLGRRRRLLRCPSFLCTTYHDGAVVRESVRFKK